MDCSGSQAPSTATTGRSMATRSPRLPKRAPSRCPAAATIRSPSRSLASLQPLGHRDRRRQRDLLPRSSRCQLQRDGLRPNLHIHRYQHAAGDQLALALGRRIDRDHPVGDSHLSDGRHVLRRARGHERRGLVQRRSLPERHDIRPRGRTTSVLDGLRHDGSTAAGADEVRRIGSAAPHRSRTDGSSRDHRLSPHAGRLRPSSPKSAASPWPRARRLSTTSGPMGCVGPGTSSWLPLQGSRASSSRPSP